MKKEDLMKIEGMTEAIAEAVANASAEELKNFIPKTRFDEVNEAKKNAEALVKERDKQIEDVKKSAGDNEDLKKQIEALQNENKTARDKYEADIRQMRITNAVNSALRDAGAKNLTAAMALLKDLDKAEISEDGTVKGLSAQIEGLLKSDAYLFETKQGGTPSGAKPAEGAKGSNFDGITKEQFNRMGYSERVNLFNTNKELYDSLSNNETK